MTQRRLILSHECYGQSICPDATLQLRHTQRKLETATKRPRVRIRPSHVRQYVEICYNDRSWDGASLFIEQKS